MNVTVNGDAHTMEPGSYVEDVLVLLGRDRAGLGLAVAVNGEVVPRVEWNRRELHDNDQVEVLNAIGGG